MTLISTSPAELTDKLYGLAVLAAASSCCYVVGYVIYQRWFHPLAEYPGPFLASITDLWQTYQFVTLKQPYRLTELHEKYGQFVRYGPDKLSITTEDAVPILYQKAGRMMPKTEFYDAYGSGIPNVFNMRDEAEHAIRRRFESHSFSMASVKDMEQHLDANIAILKARLAEHVDRNEVFDLKRLLHYYVIDVLGELAFGQSFGVQLADDESLVPPVKEHSLLAAVTGSWPLMTQKLRRWLPKVPVPALQRLFKGRADCVTLASQCVQRRMSVLQAAKEDPGMAGSQRKDILTPLILAKDPDTGEHLPQGILEAEAFGFIIAGTHTTSSTTALLFYHLLHNPEVMTRCVAELDARLPPLRGDQSSHPVSELEASLPYLRQCVRENFRISPVFTMPLARRVISPEGVVIGGRHIKQGTSVAVCNHAFHHNPQVWGYDHMVFDPSRWDRPEMAARARYLMHFGLGGRQCIGKTLAQTNIYKLTSSLLREFEFELASEEEQLGSKQGAFRGKLPPMISVGISDLEQQLLVKARRRT